MQDETSTVTNSLSKLGDQMIEMRQDMTALSVSLRTELAEMKQILLWIRKKTPSPRRKTHRRAKKEKRLRLHLTTKLWQRLALLQRNKIPGGIACVSLGPIRAADLNRQQSP
jgi:hypothetical protein